MTAVGPPPCATRILCDMRASPDCLGRAARAPPPSRVYGAARPGARARNRDAFDRRQYAELAPRGPIRAARRAARMAHILTITMNPTIDISTTIDRLVPARKLRCGPSRRDPGGGGINVARVAARLGASVSPRSIPAGGERTASCCAAARAGENKRELAFPIARGHARGFHGRGDRDRQGISFHFDAARH